MVGRHLESLRSSFRKQFWCESLKDFGDSFSATFKNEKNCKTPVKESS